MKFNCAAGTPGPDPVQARPGSDAYDPVSPARGQGQATPARCGLSLLSRWRCAIGWTVYLAIAVLVVAFAGAAAAQSPATAAAPAAPVDAGALYTTHCAACHGADRFGVMGPALLPESLERLRKPAAAETIAKGRAATQMAGFSPTLSKAEIDALVAYVYSPPATKPVWGEADIRASRVVHRTRDSLPDKPSFSARSAEPVRRRRDRRPPRVDPRRRPVRAHRAVPDALRAARRPEVLAGRALRLLRLARRLDLQVRPVEPGDGRRGARGPQHAQRRGLGRRQVRDGRQLPAAHGGRARRGPEPRQGDARPSTGRASDARASPRSTTRRRAGASSSRSRTSPRSGRSSYDPKARRDPERRHPRLPVPRGRLRAGLHATSRRTRARGHAGRLLLHPGLQRGDRRVARRQARGRWCTWTCAARSPTSTCPACRIWARASPGVARRHSR